VIAAKESLTELSAHPRGLLTVTPVNFGRRHLASADITVIKLYLSVAVDFHLSERVVDLSVRRIDIAIRIGRVLPNLQLGWAGRGS
jgi:DNA-binding transcriptional LysR family regulator